MIVKKDYAMIALAINEAVQAAKSEAKPEVKLVGIRSAVEAMAVSFGRDDHKFNRALFIQACGFPLPLGRG
jgi:hypothetical protein